MKRRGRIAPLWPSGLPHPANTHAAAQFDFLWGVATSAEQHEGGFNGPGQPQTNWAWAEQAGRVELSGAAADFWNLAEADFERCREMGLNAFRLGLSWSRIQPTLHPGPPGQPQTPPPFDEKALARYAEILAACRRAGLEPVVTLHHFAHPAWLGVDAWLRQETIDHYLAYVRHTVRFLLTALRGAGQPPPRFFITINEPNMLTFCTYVNGFFPSGQRSRKAAFACMVHLLEAHLRGRRLIHALYQEYHPLAERPQVTFNNYCSDLYWVDQGWLDLLFAHHRGIARGHLLPYLAKQARTFDAAAARAKLPIRSPLHRAAGALLKKLHHWLVSPRALERVWGRLVDLVYESPAPPVDFLAIDYYDPFAAHALRLPRWRDEDPLFKAHRAPHERFLDGITNKWWDWRPVPEGLAFFVRTLDRFNMPLLIAENGMANRSVPDRHHGRPDRMRRIEFLRRHLAVVRRLKKEGWPLIGYLHWSLVDNYEWGSYAPRFGLYTVERDPVDFRGDNAAEAYAREIAEARLDFAKPNPEFPYPP